MDGWQVGFNIEVRLSRHVSKLECDGMSIGTVSDTDLTRRLGESESAARRRIVGKTYPKFPMGNNSI